MRVLIRWHPEGDAEFDSDVTWYSGREPDLGHRFEVEVVASVEEAALDPQAWPSWPGWSGEPLVRSRHVAAFPYRVVYYVDGDLLVVVAVAHTKRRPGYWRHRVTH